MIYFFPVSYKLNLCFCNNLHFADSSFLTNSHTSQMNLRIPFFFLLRKRRSLRTRVLKISYNYRPYIIEVDKYFLELLSEFLKLIAAPSLAVLGFENVMAVWATVTVLHLLTSIQHLTWLAYLRRCLPRIASQR